MIRLTQVRLPVTEVHPWDPEAPRTSELHALCASRLRISEDRIASLHIQRRSLDARKRPQLWDVYTVLLSLEGGEEEIGERLLQRIHGERINALPVFSPPSVQASAKSFPNPPKPPLILGAGPAGLFCAYALLCSGISSVIVERGGPVEERTQDVERFFSAGVLDPDSNMQFGEGGAGAFSDGKLNTGARDRDGLQAFVLDALVRFGAPEHIRYDALPHLGTDRLCGILQNLRHWMEARGVQYHFHTRAVSLDLRHGEVCGVYARRSAEGTETEVYYPADAVVLAIGHSARDLFETLYRQGIPMEAKPFAVGFRVEHPQKMIDAALCGEDAPVRTASSYRLTCRTGGGLSAYSFCMCPGGYVVACPSESGEVVVNGMSYAARDGRNANSAIVVSVPTQQIAGNSPLDAVAFQRQLEHRAFALAGGAIPQQLYGDFLRHTESCRYGAFSSCTKGHAAFSLLNGLLPAPQENALREAMALFGQKIPGFDREDAILSGIESRTSSPVRILRGDDGQSPVGGLYPAGEGAGYAGGILSAAVDGVRTAERIVWQTK